MFNLITKPFIAGTTRTIRTYYPFRRSMTLTKARIVADISKIGFSKHRSARLVECLLENVKATLENGEDVLISGFGKFYIHPNGKRIVKEKKRVLDSLLQDGRIIVFKCSPVLSKKINGQGI